MQQEFWLGGQVRLSVDGGDAITGAVPDQAGGIAQLVRDRADLAAVVILVSRVWFVL